LTRPNAIALLQAWQAEHGPLDDEALRRIAREYRLPLYELQGLVSFYPHFRRTPAPDLEIAVCRDLACAMRGGVALRARLEAAASASTSEVEVHPASCLGRCDGAPACLIGGEPASHDAIAAALDLPPGALDAFAAPAVSTPGHVSFATDPYADAGAHYGVLRERVASGDAAALLGRIEASGLRGMGGAGFPTAAKWRVVAAAPGGPKVAVCNADESEPGTFKDREILARLPHLVVEGLALAALCVGAETLKILPTSSRV